MKVEQEFFIGVLDADAEKRVKNTTLLKIFSDMSMYHGVVAGHTKPDRKSDISWIVLNWVMKVYRRPTMFSTVRAVTWARDYTRTRATRDYIIYDEEDNIVAEAISEWVAVDVATGKLLRLTPELVAPFEMEPESKTITDYEIPSLRHVCIDPADCRDLYEDCYADAWLAAHGTLCGYDPEPYFRAACEHHRADPESVMLLYEGEKFAGLIDLDTERGRHADYGWVTLFYLRPEYRGRSLGVQLLGRAVAKYRRLGRGAIRLHVSDDNGMAKAFYRANEFEELSRAPGSGAPLLLMEKKLRGDPHGRI